MAQRRMFNKKITDTDSFLDMPLSAQALYFHLNMHADDDGFVDNARTIQRMIGSSQDDLGILIMKQFLISFEDGITVVKDWRIHNYIRKDRYTKTTYSDHKRQLTTSENGSYEKLSSTPNGLPSGEQDVIPNGNQMYDTKNVEKENISSKKLSYQQLEDCETNGIPNGNQMSPQVRLGKDRLGKDSKTIAANISTEKSNTTEREVTQVQPSRWITPDIRTKIMDFYQFNCKFGMFAPAWIPDLDQDFADWLKLNDDPHEVANIFCKALKETSAVTHIRRPFKYAESILDRWERDGLTKLSDIQASLEKEEQEINARAGKGANTYSKQSYRKQRVIQKEQLPDWAEKKVLEDKKVDPKIAADLNRRMKELGMTRKSSQEGAADANA